MSAPQQKKGTNKKTEQDSSFLRADDQDESQLHRTRLGDLKSFVTILSYAKAYRTAFLCSLGLIVLSSVMTVVSARLMGELVEKGLMEKSLDASIFFGSLIICFELLGLSLLWGGNRWLASTSSKTIYAIRDQLFIHLQKLPMTYFDHQPQGRVVTRLTHDVEGLEEFFTGSLGRLASAFFMATIAAMAMLFTYFFLGSILILSMLPAALFIYMTRNKVRTVFRQISKYSSALNAKLSEFLSGVDVIRSFGLERWSKGEYDGAVQRHRRANLKANTFFAWSRPMVSLLCVLPLMGLVWFGGREVLAGTLSVGIFVTFIRYYERFYMPVLTLAREIHVIQQAFTSAERIASFLSEASEDKVLGENGSKVISNPLDVRGEIVFDGVWMAYSGDNWILKDVCFDIRAGERIGLVGATGCGKTTTVSLLSRLYEFQRGEIYLDHHSIRDYARDELRDVIGFVSQDAVIFRSSLRENLTTDIGFDDEKIKAACQLTGLAEVMSANGLGLDSEIMDGGTNLSGGERQLVALTRVLLKNPRVLILDEATANIDPVYEDVIHRAIDKIMLDRTCLIIAHRLETLDICDRIFVFSQGRLVEEGAKEELMHKQGHFYQLQMAKKQQKDI